MPEIETKRHDMRDLRGLHLWHAALSNCSQRVRLVLEEKELVWTSHLVDLMAFEHATEEYQSIHPKGLVPLLIHDGRTITDSNDIIGYLDTAFPPVLFSVKEAQEWLHLADDCQLALRTLSHEILLGEVRRLDSEALARLGRDHRNREFYNFLHRFSTDGFDDETLRACAKTMTAALNRLELELGELKFLGGAAPGLADFSWAPNIHRLTLMGHPLDSWPCLQAWFSRLKVRRSFKRAITEYEALVPQVSARSRVRLQSAFAASAA